MPQSRWKNVIGHLAFLLDNQFQLYYIPFRKLYYTQYNVQKCI